MYIYIYIYMYIYIHVYIYIYIQHVSVDIYICISRIYIYIFNYSVKFSPTESHAGGTLLFINNKLPYRPRQDLFIYKSSGLEPTFIEIKNPKKISSLVVYIDIQQGISMNDNYLNIL